MMVDYKLIKINEEFLLFTPPEDLSSSDKKRAYKNNQKGLNSDESLWLIFEPDSKQLEEFLLAYFTQFISGGLICLN